MHMGVLLSKRKSNRDVHFSHIMNVSFFYGSDFVMAKSEHSKLSKKLNIFSENVK